jgi:hypothetical protein
MSGVLQATAQQVALSMLGRKPTSSMMPRGATARLGHRGAPGAAARGARPPAFIEGGDAVGDPRKGVDGGDEEAQRAVARVDARQGALQIRQAAQQRTDLCGERLVVCGRRQGEARGTATIAASVHSHILAAAAAAAAPYRAAPARPPAAGELPARRWAGGTASGA